eukprot:scaffold1033_cov135-Isochrysis_galbana.AAC.5
MIHREGTDARRGAAGMWVHGARFTGTERREGEYRAQAHASKEHTVESNPRIMLKPPYSSAISEARRRLLSE